MHIKAPSECVWYTENSCSCFALQGPLPASHSELLLGSSTQCVGCHDKSKWGQECKVSSVTGTRRTRWPTCNHSVKELVEDARAWPVQGDFKRLIIGWLISISVSMVTNTYKYYRKLNLGQIRYSFKNRNKKVDPGETTEVLNEEPGSSTLWKKTIFQICEVLEGLGRTHCEEYSNQPLQVCFITFLDVNNLTASKHHRPKVWAPGKWCWMIPWSSIRALFRSSWHFQETCRKHQSHQAKKWHEIVDQICIKHFWKGVAPLFPHPQAKHNPFFPMAQTHTAPPEHPLAYLPPPRHAWRKLFSEHGKCFSYTSLTP